MGLDSVATSLRMSEETPPLSSQQEGSPTEAENARAQGGLFLSLPAPHWFLGPNSTMLTDANPHYHPEILVDTEWHHQPQYLNFSDLSHASTTTPANQNDTPSSMSNAPDEAPLHDPGFFGVGLQLEGPATLPNTDNLGFQPVSPWNPWPAAGTAMDDTIAVLTPSTHFGPMTALKCISTFEPPMVPVYEHHVSHHTQEWPHSPSPSSNATASPLAGSVATFYRESNTPGVYYSPASSLVDMAQPDYQSEQVLAPGLVNRKTSLAAQGLPGQLLEKRTRSSARATTATTEAQDPASEYLTPSTQISSVAVPSVTGPAAPTASSPKRRGREGGKMPSEPPASRTKPQRVEQPPPPVSQKQRNRAAATKCRAKAKVATAQLEATERALDLENQRLREMEKRLRDEWLMLRNEVLLHGHCDCELIQQYLKTTAQNMGKGWAGRSTVHGRVGPRSAGATPPRQPRWHSAEPDEPSGDV